MKKNKTVFVEYSTFNKGQHYITAIQVVNGQRIIIGRIYKSYDKDKKKNIYHATDWRGTPIFEGVNDLATLKNRFIEYGPQLANIVPAVPRKNEQMQIPRERTNEKQNREKREKELTSVMQKDTPVTEKDKEMQKEKEQESEQDEQQEDEQNDEKDREKEMEDARSKGDDQGKEYSPER